MRSLTSCQATDMDRLFWFSLLLTHLPVTESNKKATVIWMKTGQDATLPCDLISPCPEWSYEWFVFKENYHLHLNLMSNPSKYSLDKGSLHIMSLNASDSGIYHCAAVGPRKSERGEQCVGNGTTLAVIGGKPMASYVLWLALVLLVIYSMAIVTLIILKKYHCNTSSRRKTNKNYSTKKTQFQDVLQEMNKRRNLEKRKETTDGNLSQAEAASTEFNSSPDDIYQNV
ncbi:immunoglobulin superfamily member 6 [Toxotes jaculatrix]|uniref:immunoglobulin superfamily member 6 n=1 Tax=Toxotes jaculatrix TaxID=941984 RepID=UPI001B3A8C13|nr:immunoglobulin superfamily member 6 [Toxotes jaculatrix]